MSSIQSRSECFLGPFQDHIPPTRLLDHSRIHLGGVHISPCSSFSQVLGCWHPMEAENDESAGRRTRRSSAPTTSMHPS